MTDKLDELKDRLDAEIRKGHIEEVQEELRALRPSRVPREFAADFANLARRVRMPKLSIKLLRPIIRADRPLKIQPTAKELAAYAASLSRLGAVDEAIEVLGHIRDQDRPEVELYTAFAHIFRWEYGAAIPWLKKYARRADLTAYERLVGKINLASAYVFESETTECEELILEIIAVATANDWRLLAMNAHEIRAQLAIVKNDLETASGYLKQAASIAKAEKMDDRHIIKWQRIIRLKTEGPTPEALASLAQYRSESIARQDWETVRLCDYYIAWVKRDDQLFTHVFTGTPHVSFRKKMEEQAWFEFPTECRWRIGGEEASRWIDVRTGETDSRQVSLKAGQGPHRLLQAMTKDFYKPALPGSLFALIFPGEYYDPKTSPKRIDQLATRLRRWFNENGFPVGIEVIDGSYHLIAADVKRGETKKAVDLIVPVVPTERTGSETDPFKSALTKLKNAWPYKAFSTKQAAEHLDQDPEHVRALLKEAVRLRKLIRVGQGKATLFRFAK